MGIIIDLIFFILQKNIGSLGTSQLSERRDDARLNSLFIL